MSKKKKPTIRFAFTIEHGPNAGLTSGPMRVWTHGETVYITADSLNDTWKVSLHAESSWRIAMTSEHIAKGEVPLLPEGHDRAFWKFKPPPFVDGVRRAFVVGTTRSALLPLGIDEAVRHISVKDRWDRVTLAHIWMTELASIFLEMPGLPSAR